VANPSHQARVLLCLFTGLPFLSEATPLPGWNLPCDSTAFEHVRGSAEACPYRYTGSPDQSGRVYILRTREAGFVETAHSRELLAAHEKWERAAFDPSPETVRDAELPPIARIEDGARLGILTGVDARKVFAVCGLIMTLTGIYVYAQTRKLKRENPRGYRYQRIRDDRSGTPPPAQAFLKRSPASAARSVFDWASRLFHRPNRDQPLEGLRRKSSQ
jgi:hypothetical protein